MAILRFRIYWEEDESIYRDVAVKHVQTFLDLHHIILKSFEFDNKHKATFYRSNDGWQLGREISLEVYDKSYKVAPLIMVETMIGEEEMIIGGNATSNTLEFDGLATQITTYSGTSSLLTVSGVNLYAGAIYDEGGSPTLLVANRRQTQGLADQLQGTGSIQRIMIDNQGNGLGGLRLTKIVNSIDGGVIDVVTSRYVGGLAFLLTERDDSGENMIEMDDLIPMSRVDVPSTTFSTTAFVVEATVLKVIAEPWQYKISGLAVA